MKDLFITFEGGEGTGKTTIINHLVEELTQLGYDAMKTREPGGSDIAEQIRNVILKNENTKMDYRTEALLYAASRRQHLEEIVKPALKMGKIVLCDRFIDSSLAYQGYARGLGIEEIYKINQYATEGIMPILTVFINLDPNIGLARIEKNHRETDRLDVEGLSFHEKVRQGYLEVSRMFPERVKVVDGAKSKEELYEEVKELVLKRIGCE